MTLTELYTSPLAISDIYYNVNHVIPTLPAIASVPATVSTTTVLVADLFNNPQSPSTQHRQSRELLISDN